jgi:hypothetical protein
MFPTRSVDRQLHGVVCFLVGGCNIVGVLKQL